VATRRLCTTPRTFRAFRALCNAYSVGTAGDALRRVGRQLGGSGLGCRRSRVAGRGSIGGMTDNGVPTLYEWAGGRPGLLRMIDAFYDRVEQDELLGPLFPGGVSIAHREHVATWWSEVFGGPPDYTRDLGGYEAMLAHHRDLNITAEQRFRFASLMSLAADDAGLPDDPEFRAALVGYLEWGTRIAMHNSRTGADVVEHAPVPHWGWGVAPPYQP
jgi:hemoglobin